MTKWLIGLLLLLAQIIFFPKLFESTEMYALISSSGIILLYIFLYWELSFKLQVIKRTELALIPVIYIAALIVLALLFSFCLMVMNSFLNTGQWVPQLDYFYYTIISLTSVGYGDFTPNSSSEKILSIGMALTGTLHMIIFVSTLVGKLQPEN
ncbi:ion channel [Photobacterium minamisatsumaniensis]|uniref:ion channel n=1 Tax=Photobacterium minamisatsumaniensis TaxID=2910233 RepID=UPI003D0CF766